jgi:hypothetical protein
MDGWGGEGCRKKWKVGWMVANKVSDAMEDRVCRLGKIEVSPVLDERVEQLQKKARERERADSAQGHMARGSTWINMLLPKVGLVWYSE